MRTLLLCLLLGPLGLVIACLLNRRDRAAAEAQAEGSRDDR